MENLIAFNYPYMLKGAWAAKKRKEKKEARRNISYLELDVPVPRGGRAARGCQHLLTARHNYSLQKMQKCRRLSQGQNKPVSRQRDGLPFSL